MPCPDRREWTTTKHQSFGLADAKPPQMPAPGSCRSELQARRTTSGAGLLPFLEQNLGQYQPAVAAEIMCLAKEVIGDGE